MEEELYLRIIPVRGHHLPTIGLYKEMTNSDYAKTIIEQGYARDSQSRFARETKRLLKTLNSPQSPPILVIAGKKDNFCTACVDEGEKNCPEFNPDHQYRTSAFWDPKQGSKRDHEVANKAGLKVGGLYSSREIIRKTEKQTAKMRKQLFAA
jgi:hypothetical protein